MSDNAAQNGQQDAQDDGLINYWTKVQQTLDKDGIRAVEPLMAAIALLKASNIELRFSHDYYRQHARGERIWDLPADLTTQKYRADKLAQAADLALEGSVWDEKKWKEQIDDKCKATDKELDEMIKDLTVKEEETGEEKEDK